ncbi:MAG: hypothetical protein ACXWM6_17190 [Thermodesulfobacteriota bacterium]
MTHAAALVDLASPAVGLRLGLHPPQLSPVRRMDVDRGQKLSHYRGQN